MIISNDFTIVQYHDRTGHANSSQNCVYPKMELAERESDVNEIKNEALRNCPLGKY